MKIRDTISWAEDYLNSAGIEDVRYDIELLLSEVLGQKAKSIYIDDRIDMCRESSDIFKKMIVERRKKKPVEYILGHAFFMGLKFKVNSSTLIPRPETEILVENTIDFIKGRNGPRILEIGTGCGNICISLAAGCSCNVLSIEKSDAALSVARDNAVIHNVSEKVGFMHADMFNDLDEGYERFFDCIVSNPPYVSMDQLNTLPDEVKMEPEIALDGGKDGLVYIDRILKYGPGYINSGGRIFMEIGYDQRHPLEDRLKMYGYTEYRFIKDYSGIDRIVEIILR
ncbi:peptide chain release factor N(5)-glutamine methyltransferase [Elusimicrobiota bacterium]